MKNILKNFLKHLKNLDSCKVKNVVDYPSPRSSFTTPPPSTLELESPKQRSFSLLRLIYSTLCNKAKTFGKLKRYDEALNDLNQDLNRALYQDKNNFLALKWRAFCYYEIHLNNHALWDLNLIINSGCADAFTYLNRADINRRSNKFIDANEDITKAFWSSFTTPPPSTLELESPKQRSFSLLRLIYSTLCNKAKTFGKLKRYDEALNDLNQDLNRALYQDKNNFLALKWRAFCYYEIHLNNHALWDLNLIINSGCADAFTYLNRADINRRSNKFIDANEDITKAFWFKNVNKAFAYGIRGKLKLDCKEFQDAINNLNKICENGMICSKISIKQSNNVETIGNRAKLYCKLCQYNLALKDIHEGILIDPGNLMHQQQSMDLHHRNHHYDVALGEAEVALMIDHKNVNTLLIRVDIYFLKRKCNLSLADLDNTIRIAPNNSFVLIAQSELFCKLKYYKDALNNVESALEIKSTNHCAFEVQHQDGRKEGCKVGGDKDGCEDGQDLLVSRNDAGYDKGFVVTQQIFEERNFSIIYYRSGDTYCKLGMYDSALEYFNRALKLANGYAPICKKRT
ncbi:hypothetical protein Glove_194g180 [Diversispora epigaea]|uniref:Uncharacterized protein n=1 Tax=Diversispora epigaea TaxID=1348612 RepID=A0A397IR27_9GLOM|nr:hypothetical protein Glove_194g180 [Diversispora epigaea]